MDHRPLLLQIRKPLGRQGTALIIAMIILLLLTAVGIFAVSTSTMETKIAGTERSMEASFYAADGGVEYGRRLLAWVLSNPNATVLPSGATASNFSNFMAEVLGMSYTGSVPTVTTSVGGVTTSMTIERLRQETLSGYSAQFASTEDEISQVFHYRISAETSGGASSRVITTYRHVQTQ